MRTLHLLPIGLLTLIGPAVFVACQGSASVTLGPTIAPGYTADVGGGFAVLVGTCSGVGYVTASSSDCPGLSCTTGDYLETCNGAQFNGCYCTTADLPAGYDVVATGTATIGEAVDSGPVIETGPPDVQQDTTNGADVADGPVIDEGPPDTGTGVDAPSDTGTDSGTGSDAGAG